MHYALTVISTAFTLLFCAIMTVWGARMVLFVAESDQVAASVAMPMYSIYLVVPLGMACMFLRSLNHTLTVLRKLRGPKSGAADPEKSHEENALSEMSKSW